MLEEIRKDDDKPGYSWYLCDCGKEKRVRRNAVTSGATKSCGCHRKRIAIENGKKAITHGKSNSEIYRLWVYSKSKGYLESRWSDFDVFYREMGKDYKPGMQILDGCWVESSRSKKERTAKTSLDRYGVESPTQSDYVKTKAKETNIKKYGVEFASQSDIVKKKAVETNIEKYGVPHHSMTEEYKEKASKRNSSKFEGKTSKDWSEELGVSRSYFNILVREHGIEYAISHEKTTSSIEGLIGKVLTGLAVEFETQYTVGTKIADFFIPDYNIIIEADGHYWHSDAVNNDNSYHFNKRQLYIDNGYSPLFFREGEIVRKTEIVESIISNKLGMSSKVFARKCEIVDVPLKQRKNFFNRNHLMGVGRGKCFALKINDEIVAAIQYSNRKGHVDISRFCSKMGTQVLGGFSRLLKAVERSELPSTITNFVDLRYGTGNHLEQFGFNLERCGVSFSWVKDLDCVHRMKFPGKSGYDYGYKRMYDCGQAKFVKAIKNPT